MANRNFANSRLYSGHVMPVMIDCNFVVDAANVNGLGISSLKGPYVKNVYMHTSQTPATGNPNPVNGTIVVQLQDNYNRLLTNFSSVISPIGTPVKIDNSAMVAGTAYVISTLGNASAAKWIAIGVPRGITPAVGVAFIAASDGGSVNTSTSRVAPSATAGSSLFSIELVGNPNLSVAPLPSAAQGFGAQLILQCRKASSTSAAPILTMDSYTPAGTNNGATPPIFTGTPAVLTGSIAAPAITSASAIATPADGSIISLSFILSNSSITINGE